MASQPEAKLSKKIVKFLNDRDNCFAWKTVGDPRMTRGISDIICCYRGRFIAFEVKMPGREAKVSDMQQDFIRRVAEAGGRGVVVTSVWQVEMVLAGIDTQMKQSLRKAIRHGAKVAVAGAT